MSKWTAIRKKGGDGSDWFMSLTDMGRIRRMKDIGNSRQKRQQEKFNKSSRRRKDGKPYQAGNWTDKYGLHRTKKNGKWVQEVRHETLAN